jgi:biopolymer transport protein TolQ
MNIALFSSLCLALSATAQEAANGNGFKTDIVSLVVSMGPIAMGVFFVLIMFSVISWAIIFDKSRIIGLANKQTVGFLKIFRKSSRFSEVQNQAKKLNASPLVGLFNAGYSELRYQLSVGQQLEGDTIHQSRAKLENINSINRALQRAHSVEINKLERSLNFLATTAGAGPFIGLFGTVIGIITAFQDIGAAGQTSLATVAPGIAEALIVTAAGLFAAIPALIGYNALLNKIKILSSDMDDFSMEFVSVTERSFMDK